MAAQDGARDSGFRDLLADDDETEPGRRGLRSAMLGSCPLEVQWLGFTTEPCWDLRTGSALLAGAIMLSI